MQQVEMLRKSGVSMVWEFTVLLGKGVGWPRMDVWQMYRLCSVKETSQYFEILPYSHELLCRTALERRSEGLKQRAPPLLGEHLLSILVPLKCSVEAVDVS